MKYTVEEAIWNVRNIQEFKYKNRCLIRDMENNFSKQGREGADM